MCWLPRKKRRYRIGRIRFGTHSFRLHANRVFLDEIASGDRKWRGEGVVDDWDGDGVPNPYDWTPTSITVGEAVVGVNLTAGLSGEIGGTKSNPWPIYNVWQLQAISSISVSTEGAGDRESDAFRRRG